MVEYKKSPDAPEDQKERLFVLPETVAKIALAVSGVLSLAYYYGDFRNSPEKQPVARKAASTKTTPLRWQNPDPKQDAVDLDPRVCP